MGVVRAGRVVGSADRQPGGRGGRQTIRAPASIEIVVTAPVPV